MFENKIEFNYYYCLLIFVGIKNDNYELNFLFSKL